MASSQLGVAIAGALGRADLARERSYTLRLAAAGYLRFLFVAPELLGLVLPVLRHAGTHLARIVVDEAHLVREWGVPASTTSNPTPPRIPSTQPNPNTNLDMKPTHALTPNPWQVEFRMHYGLIGEQLARWARTAQRLALTATATTEQITEIAAALGMDQPRTLVAPICRPELRMEVVQGGERADFDSLLCRWRSAPPTTPGPVGGVGDPVGDAQWRALAENGRVAMGAGAVGAAAEGAVEEAGDEDPGGLVEAVAAAAAAAAAAAERRDHEDEEEEAEAAAEEAHSRGRLGQGPKPPRADAAAGRALVYTATVEECRRVSAYVAATTAPAVVVECYYADVSDAEKKDILRRWLSGEIDIIVATIAFGMGERRHHRAAARNATPSPLTRAPAPRLRLPHTHPPHPRVASHTRRVTPPLPPRA